MGNINMNFESNVDSCEVVIKEVIKYSFKDSLKATVTLFEDGSKLVDWMDDRKLDSVNYGRALKNQCHNATL